MSDSTTEFHLRWQQSLAALTALRVSKDELVRSHQQCVDERKALRQASGDDSQLAAHLSREIGDHQHKIRLASSSAKHHQRTHQLLCGEINRQLGAGTVQSWQRQRRRERPPQRHLANLPPPAPAAPPTHQSPDPEYGQSGAYSLA